MARCTYTLVLQRRLLFYRLFMSFFFLFFFFVFVALFLKKIFSGGVALKNECCLRVAFYCVLRPAGLGPDSCVRREECSAPLALVTDN